MADPPRTQLVFTGGCPDCARREVTGLPGPLPEVGNDFDWQVRDYDGFRLFMLEELAARFPERKRWTPADMEVVLVEALAAVLDQLSDMADRVAAEAFLATARRPDSVRQLLQFIGYDAVRQAYAAGQIQTDPAAHPDDARRELELAWVESPYLMEDARRAGPRDIHDQHRMVTVEDYGRLVEEHPVVRRANATLQWSGSWSQVRVVVVGWQNRKLDEDEAGGAPVPGTVLMGEVKRFHLERGLQEPAWTEKTRFRDLLGPYVEQYRILNQEVLLQDAVPVGISLSLTVQVDPNYFQSEVRRAVEQVLGTGPGGFFEPGRLRFGEDIRAGDVIQALVKLDGVQTVCFDRFKRLGGGYADQTSSGRIALEGIELAVCDGDPAHPERGSYRLRMQGGRPG